MKAFPATHPSEKYQFVNSGMDLRDYFAAKAVHSFIMGAFMEERDIDYKDMAEAAYELADAMMKARNETA